MMGREIKRVASNFSWPMSKVWHGYLMPKDIQSIPCSKCDQSGYNPKTKLLAEQFYDLENFGITWVYDYNSPKPHKIIGKTSRWCNSITKSEVKALIDAGRLYDFTHDFIPGKGWTRNPDKPIPTPEEVNEWNQTGFGHDGINRYILVKARAKRLGVYGLCSKCKGDGFVFRDDAHEKQNEEWVSTPPPEGDWWQVWETVSEGSPVSPAFSTAEELINYLVLNGDAWDQKRGNPGWRPEAAKRFVLTDQWSMSGAVVNGIVLDGARDADKLDALKVG